MCLGWCRKAAIRWATTVLVSVLWQHNADAQKKVSCPDGDHFEIDLNQISIHYNASSFSATLSGLGSLGGRIQVDQKKLQEAAASTQQWDEYLKGLAVGFNVCAITKQQYADGLNHIYPRLQQDVADLESIRKLISQGRKADEKRLPALIDSYLSNLSEFRQITSQEDDVRERGLRLSSQITDFLAEQRSHDPGCVGPGFRAVGAPSLENKTPPCMKETRRVFVDRFEASIENLHDEFSRRGLQDISLESVYRDLPSMVGNVDREIAEVAESIRKLAVLVPPRSLYADFKDDKLAAVALDEAQTMDEKTQKAMEELEGHEGMPDAVRERFFDNFKECCLNQVEYLRAEMLKRLGPSAYDPDEMRSFNGLNFGLTEMDKHPTASIATVLDYTPHFRRLAIKLKHKANPLPSGVALHFSETAVSSGKKDFPYRVIVTIDTLNEIRSGYVVVFLDVRPAIVSTDLEGVTLVFDGRDVIDNKQLSDILTWNPARITYAFKIGKTPFSQNRPIHVVADGSEYVHVSRVLYFDE
jgi:hypothetical protein